jgi:hypothetical protein
MAGYSKRGWVPHDEGTFGGSAERVLNGQLPHQDFDERYTGGLTFLNALAFRALGINSASLRIVLLGFFVAWVPAIFYGASRFVSTYGAGCITLLAVAWSVPNYPAVVPSWYNLIFAVFGTAALFRYLEVGSHRWLFAAGFCGGLSILAKIVGLYFVAAVLLFFLFREQCLASARKGKPTENGWFYRMVVVLGSMLFLGLLIRLIHKIPDVGGLVYFVLPAICLVSLLAYREFSGVLGQDLKRFATLFSMIVPFGVGVAVPVVIFLIPYCLSSSLSTLRYGVFVLPMERFGFAASASPSPLKMIAILPIALLVLIAFDSSSRFRHVCNGIVACGGLGAILVFSAKYEQVYRLGWYSLAASIPVITLAGTVILGTKRSAQKLTLLRQQQIMLLVSVTALVSLVQFPFTVPIYYCYVAPLAILTAAALFALADRPPRFVLGALLAFYLLFAVLRVTPAFIYHMGNSYAPDTQTERLTLPRAGGLRVDPGDAELYERLIPLVQSHAAGNFVYAAPDCPEVYFLSSLQNPTRTFFDYFDDPEGRTERILRTLENRNVNVVVINSEPQFSGPMLPDLKEALEDRFSHFEEIGRFQVRWKN